MGFSDKVQLIGSNVKHGAKNTGLSALHITIRLVTGFFLGLTLGLIFQELIGFGTFALSFFTLVVMGLVYKSFSSWSIGRILIFDLFCILVASLLRMYILIAP